MSGRPATRYTAVAIVLHWTIALAILFQVGLGARMDGPPTPESFAVTQLHKSVGITILLLSLLRLTWRLMNPPPPEPATLRPWERTLSQIVHAGFYVIMIGMPLTGWLMVSASRIRLPTLLYGVIPWPDIPGLAGLEPAVRETWHSFAKLTHDSLGKAIWVLLALHVAGALKHQLFSRDEPILPRMAPGAVPGRWFEPRLLVILVAVAGVYVFGRLVEPPKPSMAAAPTPAAAAPETPPAAEPPPAPPAAAAAPVAAATPAEPSRWRVAPGSTLGFATSWSGAPIQGRFDRWRAGLVFSPDALDRSKVTVVIDLASANTGDAQRDQSLPAPDWFDTAKAPEAEFRADRFEQTGEGRYIAHGTLKLKGVTKPLDLPFRLTITGDRAEVTGTASLDRTAFGIGQGEFAATDQIPAKVTVRVQLHAIRDQR